MAKEVRNGQAEYGIRHLNEEELREAGAGVFAPTRRKAKETTETTTTRRTTRRK